MRWRLFRQRKPRGAEHPFLRRKFMPLPRSWPWRSGGLGRLTAVPQDSFGAGQVLGSVYVEQRVVGGFDENEVWHCGQERSRALVPGKRAQFGQ